MSVVWLRLISLYPWYKILLSTREGVNGKATNKICQREYEKKTGAYKFMQQYFVFCSGTNTSMNLHIKSIVCYGHLSSKCK